MKKEVIDMADVLERVQDDRELLMELLDIFEEDYLDKRNLINAMIEQNDPGQIRDIAHSMKGASGNISAKDVEASCEKIERLAEEEDMPGIKEVMPVLDQQFKELQAHIVQLKEDAKKS